MSAAILESRIDTVTVYRFGALVERVAVLPASAGETLQVEDLPLCLDDSTVRARVVGEDGEPGERLPVVRDLRVVVSLMRGDPSLAPAEPAALLAARREHALAVLRRKHLQAQRSRALALESRPRPEGKRGQPPQQSPYAARHKLYELRDRLLTALDRAYVDARAREEDAGAKLATLERRNAEASKARQPQPHELRKAVVLTLAGPEGQAAARGRLVLEYVVPGARWAPAYSVAFERSLTTARVSVRAVVSQSTGEDWRDVKLALSTADVTSWRELPEMTSLRIGRRQVSPSTRGWRPAPVGVDELFDDYDRFRHKPSAPASSTGSADLYAAESSGVMHADDVDYDDDEPAEDPSPAPKEAKRAAPRLRKPAPAPPRRHAAAPPPPPSAPPPPMSAPAPMQGAADFNPNMTRSGVLAPAAYAPQTMAARKSGGLGAIISFGGSGGGGGEDGAFMRMELREEEAAAAASTAAPAVGDEWLAYGELRMYGPEDMRRGRLVRLHVRERYQELRWVREREVTFDLADAVTRAVHTARDLAFRPLPPRHRAPTRDDGYDYVYRADVRVEVASDGDFHSVPLIGRDATAAPFHVVVPRESSDVYRRVRLRNPLDAPLLAGPADVYVGGDFLLSADLSTCAARGDVELGLGVEQAIKVARNTEFAEESAGLMGGSLVLKHAIKVSLHNHLDRDARVEVRERIPSKRDGDDEVEIELGKVAPPWERYEPEEYPLEGGYRWGLMLAAGQERTLEAHYNVKISSRRELVGGNRRER